MHKKFLDTRSLEPAINATNIVHAPLPDSEREDFLGLLITRGLITLTHHLSMGLARDGEFGPGRRR